MLLYSDKSKNYRTEMKKTGRNDPCVCGSGKKFKKCCERKMIGKKFMATKIETMPTNSNISSFFQRKITQVNTKDTEKKASEIPSQESLKKISAEVKTEDNPDVRNLLLNSTESQKS